MATNQEETKGSLSAVVAGILVIIAGFLVYNYFTKSEGPEEQITFKSTQKTEEESAETANEEGKTAGTEIKLENGETVNLEPSKLTAEEIAKWQPRVVGSEEVTGSKYTVVKGDTLWNIAQAKYGSGFEWTKILEANQEKIGYLPNGIQARIEIGVVLTLP